MDNLYIVIPAYNEKENVEQVVEEWYSIVEQAGEGSQLVVIDDGSKDNTYEILCGMAEIRPMLKPLTKQNGGHGETVLCGYRYALAHNADYVFQTDADGQTDAAEFDAFWKLRKKYDVICGYRTIRGDGRARAFVEKVVCLLLRVYFGVKVPDANAPFRLMKADVLKKYIAKLPENYTLPNVMLTAYFAYYGERLCFREISFKPRQGGTNSINIKKVIKIGWNALGDFRRFKKDIS